MITRRQQILIKRAQADACVDDVEYRSALPVVTGLPGCTTSKDDRLGDDHFDLILSYFEGIYWQLPSRPNSDVFRVRNYWSGKNRRGNNSRDRFISAGIAADIVKMEDQLLQLGVEIQYLFAIQNRIQPFSNMAYRAALYRTLQSRRKRIASPVQA